MMVLKVVSDLVGMFIMLQLLEEGWRGIFDIVCCFEIVVGCCSDKGLDIGLGVEKVFFMLCVFCDLFGEILL